MVASSAAAIEWFVANAPARVLDIAPARKPARVGIRAVHFIDIENLCSTSDLRLWQARIALREYHAAVGIADGDHVIIGASHHNALAAGLAWPGARLLPPRSGRDGADAALREAIRTERIAERFAVAYLGSGDGGFAADLAFLAAAGVTTHVVGRRHHISGRLRLAAHQTTTLASAAIALETA